MWEQAIATTETSAASRPYQDKPTLFCIHGNHERRPHDSLLQDEEVEGGSVWYEEAYENLLFAKDGMSSTLTG